MTIFTEKHIRAFSEDGFCIVDQALNKTTVRSLRMELDRAMKEDLASDGEKFDAGMVHNLMLRGTALLNLIDDPVINDVVSPLLTKTFIIYAYQSSSLQPGNENYGSRIHVDSPRFIPGYCTNVGLIFALDDFTELNGATYVLKGSHLHENVDQTRFEEQAVRATCNAGDLIVFHGRTWHRAGQNLSSRTRHSVTMNLCRSYMRQRFDFPRLLPKATINNMGTQGKQLIGMNVRMPTSLEEFYLPAEQRLYKPNQG